MMSAWEEIKQLLIVNTSPETMGRQKNLNLGADIFMALRPYFKNNEDEKFNSDEELQKAIINRSFIEEVLGRIGKGKP